MLWLKKKMVVQFLGVALFCFFWVWRSLAHRHQIIVPAGRSLTNVVLVYDTQNPAPNALKESWQLFQQQPSAINNLD